MSGCKPFGCGKLTWGKTISPSLVPLLGKPLLQDSELSNNCRSLRPHLDKLINGELTFDDYEEMFYQFAKPLKRLNRIPTSVSAVVFWLPTLAHFGLANAPSR